MKSGISKDEAKELLRKRREKAYELRQEGLTYKAIAEKLHIDPQSAFQDVRHITKQTKTEKIQEVKDLELHRLDTLLEAAYKAAKKGDTKAINMVLSIMERRAKLLALDAPKGNRLDDNVKFFVTKIDKIEPKK